MTIIAIIGKSFRVIRVRIVTIANIFNCRLKHVEVTIATDVEDLKQSVRQKLSKQTYSVKVTEGASSVARSPPPPEQSPVG